MKKNYLFATLCTLVSIAGFSTTWTVVNSGFTFSPATITITQGDSVNFALQSMHTATEVNLSSWNTNNNTPLSGGFNTPLGGGLILPAQLGVGTHYFVCTPHAGSGMKGTIIVQSPNGINNNTNLKTIINVFPNPASEVINIHYNITASTHVDIKLLDVTGKCIEVLLAEKLYPGEYNNTFYIGHKTNAKGIYFIELSIGDKKETQEIIVE